MATRHRRLPDEGHGFAALIGSRRSDAGGPGYRSLNSLTTHAVGPAVTPVRPALPRGCPVCLHVSVLSETICDVGRQESALQLADDLLADIELQRLKASEIALKASRLARLVGHDDLTALLGFELAGYPHDGSDQEWIDKTGRWADKTAGTAYTGSLANIEAKSEGSRAAMLSLQSGGNYSGDMILPASRDHDAKITAHANLLGTLGGISGQVTAVIYRMVTEIYHELMFSDLQASLFAETQANVDGELARASGSALDKIERVADRLRDGDPESVSQGLTSCRRLIDACADHVFPARDAPYVIGEQPLSVGQSNVLNRLQAYCHSIGLPKSRRDRLRVMLKELYSRCSAGTHAEVTVQEARFVFLQTYVVLGEILTATSEGEGRAQ